jgi:hypothetical protein
MARFVTTGAIDLKLFVAAGAIDLKLCTYVPLA